jgi:hypothetical protein
MISLGPYFDVAFYQARYPDWATGGASSPLQAFLAAQARGEWQQPHPLIVPQDYLAMYPDVAAAGVSPALHFAQHGDGEGRSPSAGFDAGFYARCYLRLGEGFAFRHYCTVGRDFGLLPRPMPRGGAQSAAAMARAVAGLRRPMVFCVHDAQEAGTPILTRDQARWFAARGFDPVFVLLNGGPVADDLRALGPVFLLAEGWDAGGLFRGLSSGGSVLVNSGVAAPVAVAAAMAGHRVLLMVHEMRGYLAAQGLLGQVAEAGRAGARVVVSFPPMAREMRGDLGDVTVLQPGLILPDTPLSAFRARRRLLAGGLVFIGAGHADRRKGFDLFLVAAQEISAQEPEAQFVWLGALDHWARGLADAALARGLRLVLPGFVTDYPAWYAAGSVYLLTSREDPGPTTLAHAAAAGLGFVGYDSAIGLRDAAAPLGVFVAEGDRVGYVAAALREAWARDPAARRARRAFVRENVGFDAYGRALLSLLGLPG